MDHDQRFKVLLREFFAEFIQLFLPDWAPRFDCRQIDWLDKEFFTDLPQGERRTLDLLARLPNLTPRQVNLEIAGTKSYGVRARAVDISDIHDRF